MALIHSPSIVRSGLVLYLDAANRKSYPGSGTTWFDLSGNNNNGTLNGGIVYDSSSGGSMIFDGVNDYVDTLLNSQTHQVFGDASYSFIIFFKLTQYGSSGNACVDDRALIIGREQFSGDYNNLATTITSDAAQMQGYTGTSNSIPLNKFCCFAGVRNKSAETFQAFRDGTITGTHNTTGVVRNNYNVNIFIGGGYGIGCGASTFMYGNVSIVQVYNRALTAAEVRQNFEAHRDRYGI